MHTPSFMEEELPIGTRVGDRYELLSVLGRGSMGIVYQARHQLMDRIVAIKMLRKKLMQDERSIRRFEREARAASRMEHPNIITVYDFGLTPQRQPYLVMDYAKGITLYQVLQTEGRLSAERAVHIFTQVCDALHHAHLRGVIHRDLKPSNIMLMDKEPVKDFVKVFDLGVAKIAFDQDDEKEAITRTGEVCGSPVYLSPEQCKHEELDARSDIYSIGVVLYEMLCGIPPLMGETILDTVYLHVHHRAPHFAEVAPGVVIPRRLERIVLKALQKDPEDRQQTMQELKYDLMAALEAQTDPNIHVMPPEQLYAQRKKGQTVINPELAFMPPDLQLDNSSKDEVRNISQEIMTGGRDTRTSHSRGLAAAKQQNPGSPDDSEVNVRSPQTRLRTPADALPAYRPKPRDVGIDDEPYRGKSREETSAERIKRATGQHPTHRPGERPPATIFGLSPVVASGVVSSLVTGALIIGWLSYRDQQVGYSKRKIAEAGQQQWTESQKEDPGSTAPMLTKHLRPSRRTPAPEPTTAVNPNIENPVPANPTTPLTQPRPLVSPIVPDKAAPVQTPIVHQRPKPAEHKPAAGWRAPETANAVPYETPAVPTSTAVQQTTTAHGTKPTKASGKKEATAPDGKSIFSIFNFNFGQGPSKSLDPVPKQTANTPPVSPTKTALQPAKPSGNLSPWQTGGQQSGQLAPVQTGMQVPTTAPVQNSQPTNPQVAFQPPASTQPAAPSQPAPPSREAMELNNEAVKLISSDPATALDKLNRVLEMAPSYEKAKINCGIAHFNMANQLITRGDAKQAETHYKTALKYLRNTPYETKVQSQYNSLFSSR